MADFMSQEENKNKKKKKKKIDLSKLTREELLKYEVAQELGLFEQVMSGGWGSLTAKETGKIGGIVAKRKKEMKF